MDSEKIGKFIAKLRKEKKMTQDELGKKLLVDRTMISKWERGVYIPNAEYLLKLQNLFDVSINEILYGERKNTDNNENIDTIPIKIIQDSKRKIRKILSLTTIIITILLIGFFTYYFVNNYNSIKVYKIYGENENFYISDGLMIVSKEKSYIKLGNIGKYSNMKITKTRLYFKKDNIEHDIFVGGEDDSDILLVNKFDYNELFKYDDIDSILNGLFLEIITDNDKSFILELKLYKDFANDTIINNSNSSPISDNKTTEIPNIVPKYIEENFKYDKKTEEYYKEDFGDNYTITEKYFCNSNIYLAIKQSKDIEEHFEYSMNDGMLNFYIFKDGSIVDSFAYDILNEKCNSGNCDSNLLNEFKNKYLYLMND